MAEKRGVAAGEWKGLMGSGEGGGGESGIVR